MKKLGKQILYVIIAVGAYVAVMLLVNMGMLSRQMMSLIIPVCMNIMLAVSLCLVVGFLGELSLGHAAFMSIGAYSGALVLKTGLPVVVSLPLAVLVGG